MKKLLAILMTMGVVVILAGPASAARSASESYGSPALGQGDAGSLCLGGDAPADSCVALAVTLGETSVDVTITDASGQPTYGTIGQDFNDDGLTDVSENFCGSITGFAVQPPPLGLYEVIVFPHAGPGLGNEAFAETPNPEPCVGVGTSGIVTATFN